MTLTRNDGWLANKVLFNSTEFVSRASINTKYIFEDEIIIVGECEEIQYVRLLLLTQRMIISIIIISKRNNFKDTIMSTKNSSILENSNSIRIELKISYHDRILSRLKSLK